MMMMMMMITKLYSRCRSIGRLTTMFFQRSGSSSSSSRSGLFRLLPNRPSVARSGCDERRLPTPPPSFLEHHKTLNYKKDIQICLRISPIYLPSPLSPPRAHKRHRSTIVTFFAISSHHHGSRRRQPRAQDLASVFRFGCIQ